MPAPRGFRLASLRVYRLARHEEGGG
jgi:hypothetical protein